MDTLIGPVPDDWRQVRLGEIAHIQAGLARIKPYLLPPGEEGIGLLTPSEIEWFTVRPNAAKCVNPETTANLQRYRVREGDLVCVRTGDLGRAAYVGPEHDGWLLGTSCLRLRLEIAINPVYVLRYFRHPAVRAWIRSNANYSVIPSLSTKVLGELPLVVAPLSVQATVSDVLEAWERKIAAHRELVRECENLYEWLLPRLMSGELQDKTTAV